MPEFIKKINMKPSIFFFLMGTILFASSCDKIAMKSIRKQISSLQDATSKVELLLNEVPEAMSTELSNSSDPNSVQTIYYVEGEGYEVENCSLDATTEQVTEDCCYSYFDVDGNPLDCSAIQKYDDDDDCDDDDDDEDDDDEDDEDDEDDVEYCGC